MATINGSPGWLHRLMMCAPGNATWTTRPMQTSLSQTSPQPYLSYHIQFLPTNLIAIGCTRHQSKAVEPDVTHAMGLLSRGHRPRIAAQWQVLISIFGVRPFRPEHHSSITTADTGFTWKKSGSSYSGLLEPDQNRTAHDKPEPGQSYFQFQLLAYNLEHIMKL